MKKIKQNSVITILSASLLFSCVEQKQDSEKEQVNMNTGIQEKNMDLSISPKDDFYSYVNGGWLKNNPIPNDESRWGSFLELRDRNNQMTLALVDKALAAKNVDPNTDQGKVIQFFNSGMNVEKLNKDGISPIQPLLAKIDKISNKEQLFDLLIEVEPFLGNLLGAGVGTDLKNSKEYSIYLGGGELGLPERDYYLKNDDDSKDKRLKYVHYVSKMFEFLGAEDTNQIAETILKFETQLASAKLSKEERRKPENRYNPKTIEELEVMAPAILWKKYFAGIGFNQPNRVIVSGIAYVKEVNEILENSSLDTIKTYLRWCVLNDSASYLSDEISATKFDFYGKTLRDLKEQKPRNERVLQQANRRIGEALGQLYVAEYFPKEAKVQALEMVENVRKAYEIRIQNLDWMSEATKKQAIKKLYAMMIKIGYPDQWKDYSNLSLTDTYYQNIVNARKWDYQRDLSKLGKPVDKTEWWMSPQTVNAYFNPTFNEIVFPAAILQPPFFDYKADAALNYGGIGAVIGHEISHGFDDQGAKFDANGNLKNWWTEEDKKNFEERGKQLIAQYDAYEPFEGINVSGEFTLGENIGDLGGVNSAYDGLLIHLEKNGKIDKIDNLTQEQRFFISWATIWRSKYRDEALKTQIKTDPHSPGMYRAVGPIENIDSFYEAFDIKEGDKMYKKPEERVSIW